jgi:hypothetical protein
MAGLNGEAVHFERKALTIHIVLGAPDPPVSDQHVIIHHPENRARGIRIANPRYNSDLADDQDRCSFRLALFHVQQGAVRILQ